MRYASVWFIQKEIDCKTFIGKFFQSRSQCIFYFFYNMIVEKRILYDKKSKSKRFYIKNKKSLGTGNTDFYFLVFFFRITFFRMEPRQKESMVLSHNSKD